jgi:mRNA interferase MazF
VAVIRRGEIWVANLNPTRGAEVGKVRPVLVLQADWLTEQEALTVVVVPLTTQVRPELEALRVTIPARDRLLKDCQAIPEKIRALDRRRFGAGPLTQATERELALVARQVSAVIGLWP